MVKVLNWILDLYPKMAPELQNCWEEILSVLTEACSYLYNMNLREKQRATDKTMLPISPLIVRSRKLRWLFDLGRHGSVAC